MRPTKLRGSSIRKRGKKAKSSSEEGQYEVERLVDHRLRNGVKEYRVRWKGYGSDDDQWRSEKQLSGCHYSIRLYNAELQRAERKKLHQMANANYTKVNIKEEPLDRTDEQHDDFDNPVSETVNAGISILRYAADEPVEDDPVPIYSGTQQSTSSSSCYAAPFRVKSEGCSADVHSESTHTRHAQASDSFLPGGHQASPPAHFAAPENVSFNYSDEKPSAMDHLITVDRRSRNSEDCEMVGARDSNSVDNHSSSVPVVHTDMHQSSRSQIAFPTIRRMTSDEIAQHRMAFAQREPAPLHRANTIARHRQLNAQRMEASTSAAPAAPAAQIGPANGFERGWRVGFSIYVMFVRRRSGSFLMIHFPAHRVCEIKIEDGVQKSVVTFLVPGGLHVELIPISIIRHYEPDLLIQAYERHILTAHGY